MVNFPGAIRLRSTILNQPGASLTDEDEARKQQLVALLEEHGGNISAVSRELGKARPQVQRWLKRYGLDADQYRR